MKKYLYIALAALGMMGCESDELYPDGDGVGTLVISGIEVETVVGDIQTKASMEESDIPVAADFTIVAINTETQEETTLEIGINELEAGSYIVRATYGEEKGMSYTPYFSGEKEVTLTNGETRPVSLRPSLQNAILRPKLDETLINQYNNYALNIQKDDDESITLINDKDFYLPVGTEETYTLTLFGENKLGIMVSHDWTYQGSQFVAKTRYIVNCNPDLPSFTLPAQAETNAWSKFIYVTPMTEEDFSYIPDGMTTEEILANVVYEASTDGQTWIPAITDGDKVVIKDLQASTSYTVRATYGGVNSDNTATLVTESAQELVNGDMETWDESVYYSTYGRQTIYHYYVGASSSDKYWGTRNTLTMDGVAGGTSDGVSNQRTAYRWNSCTIPTDDAVSGQAAEIRTMALATAAVSASTVGAGIPLISPKKVEAFVSENHRVYSGYLYTGATDVTTENEDPNELGNIHTARPISLSFDYKYSPYNGDNCNIYAKLFDSEGNEIASTEKEVNTTVGSYISEKLTFGYIDINKKAAYLFVMFKSGVNETWDYVQFVDGSYDATPWSLDTFVGSVLKIDNVVLNYDYE